MALLEKNYLSLLNTQFAWKTILKDFDEKWNFPHCFGAIDEPLPEVPPSFTIIREHTALFSSLPVIQIASLFLLT